jgi:hypothetical protein
MVEENEYRSTYHAVVRRRCVFEKAILTHRCACACSTRFYLADREGISCNSERTHRHCSRFLVLLRENARFALGITAVAAELPHAKEIKVQNGGLLGLQRALRTDLSTEKVLDVAGLIDMGIETYGSPAQFPYREIVKSIVTFEARRRPRSQR